MDPELIEAVLDMGVDYWETFQKEIETGSIIRDEKEYIDECHVLAVCLFKTKEPKVFRLLRDKAKFLLIHRYDPMAYIGYLFLTVFAFTIENGFEEFKKWVEAIHEFVTKHSKEVLKDELAWWEAIREFIQNRGAKGPR